MQKSVSLYKWYEGTTKLEAWYLGYVLVVYLIHRCVQMAQTKCVERIAMIVKWWKTMVVIPSVTSTTDFIHMHGCARTKECTWRNYESSEHLCKQCTLLCSWSISHGVLVVSRGISCIMMWCKSITLLEETWIIDSTEAEQEFVKEQGRASPQLWIIALRWMLNRRMAW